MMMVVVVAEDMLMPSKIFGGCVAGSYVKILVHQRMLVYHGDILTGYRENIDQECSS